MKTSRLCRRLFLIIAVMAVAAAGSTGLAGSIDPAQQARDRLIIEATYARLEEYSQASETPLSFRIDDVVTLGREDMERMLWLDAIDMTEGRVIVSTRVALQNHATGVAGVFYRSE